MLLRKLVTFSHKLKNTMNAQLVKVIARVGRLIWDDSISVWALYRTRDSSI
jgi:hypothetical protein